MRDAFVEIFLSFQYFYFNSEEVEGEAFVFQLRDPDGVLFRRHKIFGAFFEGVFVEILQFLLLETMVVHEMLVIDDVAAEPADVVEEAFRNGDGAEGGDFFSFKGN